ncbi:MAG: hypothetical protein CVV24_13020 [Ignavibacteriae bacterium HGW-Ignavibacteriae-3]|nr:MAG: hypothetical protein CVV24_13020 [Ignavibacteriae bacterium HGW-Ignavibacteriae-3]
MKRTFCFIFLYTGSLLSLQGQIRESFPAHMVKSDTAIISNRSNLISPAASYIGEFASNLSGGKERGTVYLGIINLSAGISLLDFGLWNNGKIYINGALTHGAAPSEKLLGDLQVVSNIEAGNRIYFHELWYKHSIGNAEFTIGLQDLNAEFLISEYADSFINSSFGIPSLISGNIPVPIFPLTSLGITGKFYFSENFIFQAAVYDGSPGSTDSNPHNMNWSLKKDDGALIFTEMQYSTLINNKPGSFKIGGYYHTGLRQNGEEGDFPVTIFNNNYGFYLIADQLIWESKNRSGLGLFAQLAFSPEKINQENYYIGAGFNYTGILSSGGEDVLGLSFAHAGLKKINNNGETTVEFFYKTQLAENIFIQPDIQYIINPSGTDIKLDNSFAMILRFGINL